MKLRVEYTSSILVEQRIAKIIKVAPFGIPSGIPENIFTAAGQLLVGSGGNDFAVLPAPLTGGQSLISAMDELEKVKWGYPALDGIPGNGWSPAGVTWVYVSANSFKIVGENLTYVYIKGAKLKCTQTTGKYFYCLGSTLSGSDTVVTVNGGSDYSLANAVITDPYYSYMNTPQMFPGYFNYTSSWIGSTTNPVLGNGMMAARYSLSGGVLHGKIFIMAGSTTTYGSGYYSFGLPFAITSYLPAVAIAKDDSAGLDYFDGEIINGPTNTYIIPKRSGGALWSSAVPFTWAQNDTGTITFLGWL